MEIVLWGVRGSIPTPGRTTVKYGGNTTCVEVITESRSRIIIDGGSGIRLLGNALLAHMPLEASLFITHTHWDHIQGLPFFVPFFIPGNTFHVHGAFDPVYQKDLQTILTAQMEYCYFPVRSNELKADITYSDLHEGQIITVGDATVTPIVVNHPVLTYAYRIEADGASFFFTADHEPPVNIYEPDDDEFEEYQELLDAKTSMLHGFAKNVDLLLADAQYTAEEYQSKKGWGHSSHEDAVAFALSARAKQVILTHHDPTRSDAALDAIQVSLKKQFSDQPIRVELAREGARYQL